MTQAAAQSSASATADVIVVGAGPAGSSAAFHMATLGLDVILLEKQELGRDKVCGDGLTPSAVRELVSMGVDTSGWQRNRGLRVIGGGHLLHFPWPEQASFPSYGMARPRALLDRDLAEHAAAQEIEPTVSHMSIVRHARLLIEMQHGRRRSHPLIRGIPRRGVQHLLIGTQNGCF